MSGRVQFMCDGAQVEVDAAPGETLLSVLRERLGIMSVKDGCAPQGQCGCCTVLVDGAARVACVTPVARIAGRDVITVDGLPEAERDSLAAAFVATGGSQCGFCTPGILVRAAGLRQKGEPTPVGIDRALAAHLCRCTGWRTVVDAIGRPAAAAPPSRMLDAASRRAALEGGGPQRVGTDVALGRGGFADDTAPRGALVAVPLPPGSDAPSVEAAGLHWVIAESLLGARALAGKVQGRRTTVDAAAPLPLPALPDGGVRLATSWVEPAYLEPDASWCVPGGEPASPLANGGAFGGKTTSPVATAARELADRHGRAVRTLFSREDVVRLGPKRPPFAASAVLRDGLIDIEGTYAGERRNEDFSPLWYRGVGTTPTIWPAAIMGPPVSRHARAAGYAEARVLMEGALEVAGFDRAVHAIDERSAAMLLDNVVRSPESRALASAHVSISPESGALERVEVRVAAGDPLDDVVLRWYAIGAAHMALGWVLTEGLAVDPETGEVHDLTIRSFGVIRAKDTPAIDVTIVDDPGPPLARSSDAVFCAVAAATWNTLARRGGYETRDLSRPSHPHRSYAPDMTGPEALPTPNAPPVAGPYSAAVRAGDWLVLAGQVPLDPATGKLVAGDAGAQCRQVLANITAVLGDCDATLADVAKTTVFVTDLADFAAMNAVYAEAFGDHKPTRSTVQVAALPIGAKLGIEAWAFRPVDR